MPETPGREPEQRLPAVRPSADIAPVERFSSPPSARAFELTPERAAQVVRQSSNARWVGFLVTVVVILFTAIYWFYEVGPLGISTPRLEQEATNQQVVAVERGYNVFQANCARCHGEQGEGGVGPVLNRQDKLFVHLNENFLRQVLNAGGRYVCGNPTSAMPVWADTANPPGPLNYIQIDDLIAFIRAPSDETYVIRDPKLFEPEIDPVSGKVKTFSGWREAAYKPSAGATPFPDCWTDEFNSPTAAPSGSADPSAVVVDITASGIAFTTTSVTVPADAPFVIAFDNQDATTPHNVEIKDAAGATVFKGAIFSGAATQQYQVPALAAGEYPFVCSVHPNMTGTLTAE